jgi:hypothetical protein
MQLFAHLGGGLESGCEIVMDPRHRQLLPGERAVQQLGDLAPAPHQQQVQRHREAAGQGQGAHGAPAEAAHRRL